MEITAQNIKKIWLTDEAVCIETKDGKTAKEIFANYPRLRYATQKQRESYTTDKYGIRWEEIDEDLSFEGFFKEKSKLNDITETFKKLHGINVSALARRLRIPQPLMADYISGKKTPSKTRKKEIEKELHRIGKELLEISF